MRLICLRFRKHGGIASYCCYVRLSERNVEQRQIKAFPDPVEISLVKFFVCHSVREAVIKDLLNQNKSNFIVVFVHIPEFLTNL